jgi:hypothetical protein
MTTTVLPCPHCKAPVRLREGESHVQCVACGRTVSRVAPGAELSAANSKGAPAGAGLARAVLPVSFALIACGFVSFAMLRPHRQAVQAPLPPLYTAPPMAAVTATPAGELAWEPVSRSPVIAAINGDDVEDIFGFFRVWDGRSAWVPYAGAFDGATLKPLWRTEAIDPQILKRRSVLPYAVVLGKRVVVSDATSILRVFALATGEKEMTLELPGIVIDFCRSPEPPARIWIKVDGNADTLLDLDTGKSKLAPRPTWCPVPAFQAPVLKPPPPPWKSKELTPEDIAAARLRAACEDQFQNGPLANATCRVVAEDIARASTDAGVVARYELTDGTFTFALGSKAEHPFAESLTKGSAWAHDFITDDTKARPLAPSVADIAFGRLYAVYDKVYFDARLTALDAKTGRPLWDVPLVGSVLGGEGASRGNAHGLVTTASRVYVTRIGGGLDVFDAASGEAVGSIGKH